MDHLLCCGWQFGREQFQFRTSLTVAQQGATSPPLAFPNPSQYYAHMGPLVFIRRLRDERRALGWIGLLKKRGWKLLVLFVIAYLIRDTVLYIIIPLGTAAWLFR